ncbi:hypothetical protein MKX03_020230 [Papaver bracteatum]|nr:hypothetical protein MKX03_020230 [Papaver bracteatum]
MHRPQLEVGSSSDKSSSSLPKVLVRKGVWSEAEDALLRECIEKYGIGKWTQVPPKAGLNPCRKSCRLRWLNYLDPSIKRGEFETDEVDLIIRMHKLLGNRWSLIAGKIPGRTANDIRNYYNTHLLKKTSFSKHNTKGKKQIIIVKKLGHNNNVQRDDQQGVECRRPCLNTSTSNITKVIKSVPGTFKWITNEAATSTATNHNNLATTTRFSNFINNNKLLNSNPKEIIKSTLWSQTMLFDEAKRKEADVEDEDREKKIQKKLMTIINSNTTDIDDNGNSTNFNVKDGATEGSNKENKLHDEDGGKAGSHYYDWNDFYLDDSAWDVLGDL